MDKITRKDLGRQKKRRKTKKRSELKKNREEGQKG
jgi:hypothetical protein